MNYRASVIKPVSAILSVDLRMAADAGSLGPPHARATRSLDVRIPSVDLVHSLSSGGVQPPSYYSTIIAQVWLKP